MKLDVIKLVTQPVAVVSPSMAQIQQDTEMELIKNLEQEIIKDNINQKILKISLKVNNNSLDKEKIKKLLKGDFDFYISKYTDYIFITFINDWKKHLLDNLVKLKKINNILEFNILPTISEDEKQELDNIDIFDTNNYSNYENFYEKNFNIINFSKEKRKEYFEFSKNREIKVGVLDSGKIKLNKNIFLDTNKIINRSRITAANNNNYSDHATEVASIIGGIDGINPNIHLYGIQVFLWNGIEQEIEWLINQGVKIINVSQGFGNNKKYNGYARYFDELSSNRNREVTIVTSAGNDGNKINKDERVMKEFKLGYHVISVSALDSEGVNPAEYSSYGSTTGKMPTVSAPGTFEFGMGTSYASPIVAGLLASLMEKKWQVYSKGLDSLISIAALTSSSKNVKNIDEKLGSGRLDALNLEKALDNLEYVKINGADSAAKLKEDIKIKKVFVKKGENLRVSLVWNFQNKFETERPWYLFGFSRNIIEKPILQDFDLYIKNSNNDIIKTSASSDRNVELVDIISEKDDWYTIEVHQYTKISEGDSFDLAISHTIN